MTHLEGESTRGETTQGEEVKRAKRPGTRQLRCDVTPTSYMKHNKTTLEKVGK